jgi:type II secretory pathway pseudopilin PulG
MSVPISPQKPSALLRQWLLKQWLHPSQNTQQGLTIMECLVAIMLIALTIAMVTPPLLIATASRVQTRRGEQAQQVAQDEVDRVNTLVQRGLHQNSSLPADAAQTSLKNIGPPTKIVNFLETPRSTTSVCPTLSRPNPYASYPRYADQPLAVTDALPIDVDGDCDPDFFMQVIRNGSQYTTAEAQKASTTQRPARFDLGVRVYADLIDTNKTLASGRLKTDPASLGLTIGQGQQATNPLAVVYKTLSWGERSEVLCQYATQANRNQLAGCN